MEDYYNSNKFKDMLRSYEDGMKEGNPPYLDVEDLTDIAEYYHNSDKPEESRQTVDYALSLFPDATEPLALRARIALVDDNDIYAAREYAERIEDKTDLEYFYITAEIMLSVGEFAEADKYLNECLRTSVGDEADDFALDVATLFADYNFFDLAEKWFHLCIDDNSDEYNEIKGRIALEKGNYEEGERIYNELLDRNPFSTNYWNGLASSQMLHNELSDSITSSEFSIAIDPHNAEAIYSKANGLFILENYTDALTFFNRYNKLCPNDETGEMSIASCLFNLNRDQEGIIHLKQAEKIAIKKGHQNCLFEIYKELAYAESSMGHVAFALEYVNKLTGIYSWYRNDAMVLRGYICLENNDMEQAVKHFHNAMIESKHSPRIYLCVAIAFYDNGNIAPAYEMLNKLVKQQNNRTHMGYSYLALCCNEMGLHDQYLANVKAACELNPHEASKVLSHLFPEGMDTKDYYQYLLNQEF